MAALNLWAKGGEHQQATQVATKRASCLTIESDESEKFKRPSRLSGWGAMPNGAGLRDGDFLAFVGRVPGLVYRVLNAIAFWFFVAAATLVSCVVNAPRCSKSKAYVTAMKSDLRYMTTAQEEYHREYGHYADAAALRSGDLAFRSSTGVLMTIEHADARGWRAGTRHQVLRDATCSVASGDPEIRCSVPGRERPISLTGNPTLDWAIDLWLIAFSLARRQRRLATATT
jgi:hypothetical protein